MNTQSLYLTDPLTLTFEAQIQERLTLADGRLGVILNQTYFYPTGGGQAHDTGTLGQARVVEVLKSEDGQSVIHILDGEPGEGRLPAKIDRQRRLNHMQHHTGQHLLSGCFHQLLGLETLSSSIHAETPTTIDLPDMALSEADLKRVEERANQIVFENRAVKSYFMPAQEIGTLPLRRPPKVSANIRVVEIDSFDYSACGATHCPQTGMIGMLKIVRTERINQKLRIHFVAGTQALVFFHQYQEIATSLAAALSTHPGEVVELVERQMAQLQSTQKELEKLRSAYSTFEAQDLINRAETLRDFRLVTALFESRPAGELRTLGNALKVQPDLVALLATYDGKKLVLLVTCGENTGHAAQALLNQQLTRIGGRGGGDQQIAQGGGPATTEQFTHFFDDIKSVL